MVSIGGWGALYFLPHDQLRWSTCPLDVGPLDLSQAEKEKTACKAEQIHKITTIFTKNGPRLPFWMKIVVILWICSTLQAFFSFSAWDKSRDP